MVIFSKKTLILVPSLRIVSALESFYSFAALKFVPVLKFCTNVKKVSSSQKRLRATPRCLPLKKVVPTKKKKNRPLGNKQNQKGSKIILLS